HANIVSIFDMNVLPPNRYYLVMEFLEGASLESKVGNAYPIDKWVNILTQVCDALDQAHQAGIVHRDLKPENVMLVKRGREENFVKVLDFGIAKLQSQVTDRKTATGVIIGTPDYMAPEQASGDPIDGRTDQYSLGVIAYELATGKTPFAGLPITAMLVAHLSQDPKPPHQVNPAVPLGVSNAIMKALGKRPEGRFATCGDFGRALEEALAETARAASTSPVLGPQAPPAPSSNRSTPSPLVDPPTRATPADKPGTPPPAHHAVAAAQQAPPRHVVSFEVEVKGENGVQQKLQVQDVSRAGCFIISTQVAPRIFSKVLVTLPRVGAVQADVVRHVTAEQAQAWNMPQGFGVQFVSVKPEQREALDLITKGLPLAPLAPESKPTLADDPVAEKTLAEFRRRVNGDHYIVLGLHTDIDVPSVRAKGRELSRQLIELKKRPLSTNQEKQVDAALERVQQAVDVLGLPAKRVEFDGMRLNWKGVAMCLAGGLRVPELEAVRARFLTGNPGAEMKARFLMITANGLEADGQIADAVRNCEQALTVDPLNLDLHHKRQALLKKLR
ncbi:MAG TPA: serine/threonine-protein kinase, partial [Archangium sp.]